MLTFLIRDWNLRLIGAIKAESCFEAQAAWEAQAGNGAMVLAVRATPERVAKACAQGWR